MSGTALSTVDSSSTYKVKVRSGDWEKKGGYHDLKITKCTVVEWTKLIKTHRKNQSIRDRSCRIEKCAKRPQLETS